MSFRSPFWCYLNTASTTWAGSGPASWSCTPPCARTTASTKAYPRPGVGRRSLPSRHCDALVVTWARRVLAFHNWYATGSVQRFTRSACRELCCTACPGADNEFSRSLLSPDRPTPLHVGNSRCDDRRSACVPYHSFLLSIPFANCHHVRRLRVRDFTKRRLLLSVRSLCRPSRFRSACFRLSCKH